MIDNITECLVLFNYLFANLNVNINVETCNQLCGKIARNILRQEQQSEKFVEELQQKEIEKKELNKQLRKFGLPLTQQYRESMIANLAINWPHGFNPANFTDPKNITNSNKSN